VQKLYLLQIRLKEGKDRKKEIVREFGWLEEIVSARVREKQ
jgi:hypothetical protein